MKNINANAMYQEDVRYVCDLPLAWSKLEDASILISGATGLIGSFLIDVIMKRNEEKRMNCKVYAISRSEERLKQRFPYTEEQGFYRVAQDVKQPLKMPGVEKMDYVLHMASNVHPLLYSTDPIGTIETNVIGTNHMLQFAVAHHARRFLFTSSEGIYGENRGDCDKFNEAYSGYIDSNTLRAGYPESKRTGEALCQAYMHIHHLEVAIPRLCRIYGPTMSASDSKVIAQFIRKAAMKEDIVLKSKGGQLFSYLYVSDAVSGILTILMQGESGNAYNVADERSDETLRTVADMAAQLAGTHVVFEEPDNVEKAGYSPATKAVLDSSKLQSLGWKARYSLREGLERTIRILGEREE